MEIPIAVSGQTMHLQANQRALASGSQNFVKIVFDLSEDWDALTAFAQFTQNGESYNVYLDLEDSVYLPAEIVAGDCTMMLYGTGENSAIGTTNAIRFCIADNGFVSDGQSTEITESLYQQLVNEVRQYVPFSHIATMEEAAAYLGY